MAIPVAAGVGIAAFSAYSSYRQTQLTNAQKRAEARTAEINAQTAEIEGDLALQNSIRLEADNRRQTKQLIGAQRAAMSATGFAVGEGSFANIIETSVVMGELDSAVILFEGELAQFRKRKEAQSLRAQARSLKASQQDPLLAGLTSGALTGAALL
jgi:hypothetical protein